MPRKIVIVGGGTAGWMAAAALSRILDPRWTIDLIESDAIGTVGVGEATIPQILLFNGVVGIDESEFMKATGATFKLGIEFVDWLGDGGSYMHAFGQVGRQLGLIPFQHYWLQAKARGDEAPLAHYNLSNVAAKADRFQREDPIPNTPLGAATYAYHFDASLYAKYLRALSEARGVRRTEGKIVEVVQDEGGDVRGLKLDHGGTIEGDFFIDCSGFRALLIGEAMGSGYEDWSHLLMSDSAIAVPCESVEPVTPYTRATARPAGWQWRIPLQHRIGNGHVFSSKYMDADEAEKILLDNLDGKPLADPKLIKFKTGFRRETWKGNVVALGLSSGFLEPLESTSIHLIQAGIRHLIDLLPNERIDPADVAVFNGKMAFEYERVKDFIILHYWANGRSEPFWQKCREIELPEMLKEKVETFRAHGRIFRWNEELFTEQGWLQVMVGQGIMPESYHPLADAPGDENVDKYLASIRELINAKVARMPAHRDYLNQYCRSEAHA